MLLVIAIIGVSCISEDMDSTKLDLKHLDPFVEKMAPIKDGMKTVISVDGKIICETTIEMPYLVSKGKTVTIEYQPVTKSGYENGGYATHQFMAMFEDTRNGDNDYNDFVCYITVIDGISGSWNSDLGRNVIRDSLTVYVQPLALGATKNFKFGIKFPNNEIWMAAPNSVRTDFFDGRTGFINVDSVGWPLPTTYFLGGDIDHIKRHLTQTFAVNSWDYYQQRINPFIVLNSGDTIYLAIYNHTLEQSNYNNIVSQKGYPYGIALPKTPWALETIKMADAYTNFTQWLLGNEETLNIYNFNTSKVILQSVEESQVLGDPQGLNWGSSLK